MSVYKIADILVEMNPIYEPLKTQSIDYLYEGDIQDGQIDCIIPQGEKIIEKFQKEHPHLSIGECEYLLYGTYFYHTLIDKGGFMMHASAVCYQNQSYLFSAPSGTGKSTHANNWLKVFSDAQIINDDKPAIRIIDNKVMVYGTPFSGKTNQNINTSCVLKGISFLSRGEVNEIEKMPIREAVSLMFYHTIRPFDERRLDQLKSLIEIIIIQIPIFDFKCNVNKESVYVSYEEMNKNY